MRNPPPLPPPGSRIAPFCGFLTLVCKENMACRLAKRRCTKYGGDVGNVQPLVAPPWVHRCDPRYTDLEPICGQESASEVM